MEIDLRNRDDVMAALETNRKLRTTDKKEIGKLELEYDGSIVVCGEVAGKLWLDCLTAEQTKEFNAELVRRWNLIEEKKDQ